MELLKEQLNHFFPVSEEYLQLLQSKFAKINLKKNEFFSEQEGYVKKMGFVTDGHLRIYSVTDKKEITQWISGPGYFVTEINSFLFNAPARWNIQAISDCTIYVINKEDYLQLNNEIPKWSEIERLFIGKCFAMVEDRVFGFLSMNAEERYHHLKAIAPDLFNSVPQQYLASMLGITPETFSRIRAKS